MITSTSTTTAWKASSVAEIANPQGATAATHRSTQIDTDEQSEEKRQRDRRSYAVLGAAIEVHRQLGNGFLEAVHQEALVVGLARCGIPTLREVTNPVYYLVHTPVCGNLRHPWIGSTSAVRTSRRCSQRRCRCGSGGSPPPAAAPPKAA
ncbi:MAG: GxxExxY protein [Sphingomonadaceae bacterium]